MFETSIFHSFPFNKINICENYCSFLFLRKFLVPEIVNSCLCINKIFRIQKEAENLRMRLICHSVPGSHRGKMCLARALQGKTPQWTPHGTLMDTQKC